MKKKTVALILAAVMLFALTACSASSSSSSTTTISTTVTDADGNIKTNTVVNEIGVSAGTDGLQYKNDTNTYEFEENEEYSGDDAWYNTFSGGAEGVSEEGQSIYFAYDDLDDICYAMFVFVSPDESECYWRNGGIVWDDEYEANALYDEDVDVLIPFEISDSDEENAIIVNFLVAGDVVTMDVVPQDVIITDIQNVLSNYTFE